MKNIITILLIIISAGAAQTQQNLEFHQPFTIGGSYFIASGWGVCGSSSEFTVPENKVWKIEKYPQNGEMHINNIRIDNTVNSTSIIWLKAGDTIRFSACNVQNSYGGNREFFFNGIEFNLINQ